jgi:hypothetical protein
MTSPFIYLLLHTWGCGGPVLTLIYIEDERNAINFKILLTHTTFEIRHKQTVNTRVRVSRLRETFLINYL